MTYDMAMDFINSFTKSGKPVDDLSRFAYLMNELGNPQAHLKCIHIAGTNGKGSVTRYCAEACRLSGYKTGEFTSPYVIEYTDRIRVNGVNIPKHRLAEICEMVEEACGDNKDYSQFEITNAIAFEYFYEEKCDIVCLETGVGGLLDSTNIIDNPLVSVITSVALDHTAILGETVEEIAKHKAGIIKPGVPVVASISCPKSAQTVIIQTAARNDSEFIVPDINTLKIKSTNIWGNKFIYKSKEYSTKMIGRHQMINAMTAIEALDQVKRQGYSELLSDNVKQALKTASIPGRMEILNLDPLFLLDGCHNPEAMQALVDVIKRMPKKPIIVIGMLKDKDFFRCAEILAPCAKACVGVGDFHPNCVPGVELEALFKKNGCPTTTLDKVTPEDVVVFCGSLYFAEKIRKEFIE